MVAKSELQFAGEFLIDECTIISTTGKPFDIRDIIEEVNIYENIQNIEISINKIKNKFFSIKFWNLINIFKLYHYKSCLRFIIPL